MNSSERAADVSLLTDLRVVHIFPAAESDDDDQQDFFVDRVDDPIVANSHSEAVATLEGSGSRRSRVFTQQRDGALNAGSVLRVDATQCLDRRRPQLDAVAHCQPRSAFT